MAETVIRRLGHGQRHAFFAHCSLSSGKSMMPLMSHFVEEMTMAAIDLPGQGKSALPDMNRDYHTQCIEACLDEIEMTGGPQDLVGHSFGATVVLALAAQRPDLVRSLVLFEPVYFGLLNDAGHDGFSANLTQEKPFNDAIERGDMLSAAEAFLTRWGLPGEWDAMPQATREAMASRMWVIPAQADGIINEGPKRMKLDAIRDLDVPTLIMHGANSPKIMEAITDVISSAMPNGQGDVLDGAGHMLPITHHADCAAKLRAFWSL
ncbi:alpha/beta hydrolase [Amylibacter sp. IMCC11727]|uniref:alpha/beta fold hydrolase n=1 Tax=Amylibacter sp. IMCC11727 TaxID=3039851 RepID=UPI00244DC3EA|nr:alpha/beta hydrolase [Amylibacter sp. IMCC11727]WGI22646.1 alpha/beta hydrolase [Amylibacter sp. IMCC11727]